MIRPKTGGAAQVYRRLPDAADPNTAAKMFIPTLKIKRSSRSIQSSKPTRMPPPKPISLYQVDISQIESVN